MEYVYVMSNKRAVCTEIQRRLEPAEMWFLNKNPEGTTQSKKIERESS